VDLSKLTSLEGGPETVDATAVDVVVALVSCPPNLVEVPEGKPPSAGGWLLRDELGEELILPVGGSWPIHPRNLEVPIVVGVKHADVSGQTELRGGHIGDRDDGSIPKKEYTTPRTGGRPFREALETVPAYVASISLRDGSQLSLLKTDDVTG
jgi:hypothetical protein